LRDACEVGPDPVAAADAVTRNAQLLEDDAPLFGGRLPERRRSQEQADEGAEDSKDGMGQHVNPSDICTAKQVIEGHLRRTYTFPGAFSPPTGPGPGRR